MIFPLPDIIGDNVLLYQNKKTYGKKNIHNYYPGRDQEGHDLPEF
jgi:hypothetical protein